MADNYLEKKYEELRLGRPVVRKSSPSLDTLVKRIGASSKADHAYSVKQAQLDAVERTARSLGGHLTIETRESAPGSAACIRIISTDGFFHLGQAVLAVRLKAAELLLDSSVEPGTADGDASATVFLFRGRKA